MSEDKKKRTKDNQENPENENPKSANGDGEELEEDQPMVALTYDEFDALEKRIESLQTDVEEKQDQWLRTLADFENYKKRVQRDATRTYQDAVVNVVKAYLPIADDLERALQNRPPDTESNNWFAGIELILQKLITLLKNQGLSVWMSSRVMNLTRMFMKRLLRKTTPILWMDRSLKLSNRDILCQTVSFAPPWCG